MKFDRLYKLIVNEADEFEDKMELDGTDVKEPDAGLETTGLEGDVTDGSDAIEFDDIEQTSEGDVADLLTFDGKVKYILTKSPKLTPEEAAKIVKADLFDTFVNQMKDLGVGATEEVVSAPEELSPDLESDKPQEQDIEDISGGLNDYRRLSDLETEDDSSLNDQEDIQND